MPSVQHITAPVNAGKPVAAAQHFAEMAEKFPDRQTIGFVSTGEPSFDRVMSGGMPFGKFIELRSKSGDGKSTAAFAIAKHLCDQGLGVLHFDIEMASTDSIIEGTGLIQHKGTRYFPHQVSTFEEVEEILEQYVPWEGADRGIRLVIFDSITGLIPAGMREKSCTTAEMGWQARPQGNFLRKYKALAAVRGCSFLFINQERTKTKETPMGMKAYDDSSGSRAFEYYCDIRLEFKRIGFIYKDDKKKGDKIGVELYLKAFKTRMGMPERRGRVAILWGKGFDLPRTYMELLIAAGDLTQSGPYYTVDTGDEEPPRFLGKGPLLEWLGQNSETCWRLLDERGYFR